MILVHFHYLHIWSQPERERSEKERKFIDLSPIWWQKPSNISQNDLFALFSTQSNASTITSFQIRLVHPYIPLMEGWSKRKRSKKAVSNSIHEISIFFRHVTLPSMFVTSSFLNSMSLLPPLVDCCLFLGIFYHCVWSYTIGLISSLLVRNRTAKNWFRHFRIILWLLDSFFV